MLITANAFAETSRSVGVGSVTDARGEEKDKKLSGRPWPNFCVETPT